MSLFTNTLVVTVVPQVQGSCRLRRVQLTERVQTTLELVLAGYEVYLQ